MGGCLRFKVSSNHKMISDANTKKVSIKTALATINTKKSRTIAKLLDSNNRAYLEYNVTFNGNILSDQLFSHSKVSSDDFRHLLITGYAENKLGQALTVNGTKAYLVAYPDRPEEYTIQHGKTFPTPRDNDTEKKLLEELCTRFPRGTSGEVHLYTVMEPCLSCDIAIHNFCDLYPEIYLFIYYLHSSPECIMNSTSKFLP